MYTLDCCERWKLVVGGGGRESFMIYRVNDFLLQINLMTIFYTEYDLLWLRYRFKTSFPCCELISLKFQSVAKTLCVATTVISHLMICKMWKKTRLPILSDKCSIVFRYGNLSDHIIRRIPCPSSYCHLYVSCALTSIKTKKSLI